MLRFIRALDGEIIFDSRSCLPGRGDWLCGNISCFERAFFKKLLFKGKPTLSVKTSEITDLVAKSLKEDLFHLFKTIYPSRKFGLKEENSFSEMMALLEPKKTGVVTSHKGRIIKNAFQKIDMLARLNVK